MSEHLVPGIEAEKTLFPTNSAEGVSTTATGFVGPGKWTRR